MKGEGGVGLLKDWPDTKATTPDHLNDASLFHMGWLGDVEGTKIIDPKADLDMRNSKCETA